MLCADPVPVNEDNPKVEKHLSTSDGSPVLWINLGYTRWIDVNKCMAGHGIL